MSRKLHRNKTKGVLLKLDISRRFDSLSWPFLFEVLPEGIFREVVGPEVLSPGKLRSFPADILDCS